MAEFIILSGVFMNKKIIGLGLTVVFVSFNCVFAMDRFSDGAPNDSTLIELEYYLELFEQERQERRERLEQEAQERRERFEQEQAKKEQERKALSHEAQMQEYVAKHRRKLAELQDQGKVEIVIQESNNQEDSDDEVAQVVNLFNRFTVSTRVDYSGKQLGKRDDSSSYSSGP